MVAARWRIRRMWTIETGLLNAEILAQVAETDTPDPDIHLASAFRSLTDDSRSLALASRYEARLQRLYDRAYKTLRELQQVRKSQEPTPPHTINYRWVDQNEDPYQPAEPDPPAPETGLRNEPTVDASKEVVAQTSVPANDDPENENSKQPYDPLENAAETICESTTIRNPTSEIRNPSSAALNQLIL